MYPPFPEDARLAELERQLPTPTALTLRGGPAGAPERLPVWLRVGLIASAVVLLLVGVAGLFLPGIQGIVTILAGVALLSLVSSHADRFLRWSLGPWPTALDKVEDLRERSRRWLMRLAARVSRRRGCAPPAASRHDEAA
ncbi:MAG TPA: PGPGW domain-containing protein [Thermoanaerobaculia bacterium]|nr:PGPGW domain-containing protein [Thermoanaerobaculia bacterium]